MSSKPTDFEVQWQRRKQAVNQPMTNVPSDATLLEMARRARVSTTPQTVTLSHPRFRWIPYAAAASVLIGLSIAGLNLQNKHHQLPVAKVVSVEGQNVRFLCNSGCSVDDVVQSVHHIMNK